MNEIDCFDTIAWLVSEGIDFITSGKDVSAGWVGVKCPFCTDGDPEYHLGINLDDTKFPRNFISCWRCATKGSVTKYIKIIKGGQVKKIIEEFQDRSLAHLVTERVLRRTDRTQSCLPLTDLSKEFSPYYRNYLIQRNYDPDLVIRKYDLYVGNVMTDWAYRIVFPIYLNHNIVTFTSRSVDPQQIPAWKALSKELSFVFSKETLYNIDNAKRDTVIVVEGIFDVWRLGDGAVATLGTQYTPPQVRMLAERFKRAVIMYDAEPEAQKLANRLAFELSFLMPKDPVILNLPENDPDTMTEEQVKWVRKEVFGRE